MNQELEKNRLQHSRTRMKERPCGCWRGAQLQVTKKVVFDVIQPFLQGKQQPNSGQLRYGQTGILAEAERSALRIIVHRVILKYSWFLFLVQGHFVAFYRVSEYSAHWESGFSVSQESLLFLATSCHLSQEGARGQCSLWSMARVLHFALLLSFFSLALHPPPALPRWRGSALEKLWKDINGGLFILYKDALFASRGERNKCQKEKRHCDFSFFQNRAMGVVNLWAHVCYSTHTTGPYIPVCLGKWCPTRDDKNDF